MTTTAEVAPTETIAIQPTVAPSVDPFAAATQTAPVAPAPAAPANIKVPDYNTDPDGFMRYLDDLPYEERLKVEQGLFEVEQKPDAKPESAADNKPAEKPVEKLPGDAPVPEKELGWDEDELLKMDPHSQKSIRAMNERLEQLGKYESEEFKSLQGIIEEDPIIKNRLKEINDGKVYKAPNEIKATFDPNKIVTQADLIKLNLIENPDEYAKELSNLLKKAYDSGIEATHGYAEVKAKQEVENARKLGEYEKQLTSLMEKNNIKSDLPFDHKEHPMRDYINWVADSGVTQEYIDNLGNTAAEALYAAYMVKNGGLNKMIDNAVRNKNSSFIRKMNEARDSFKTLSRSEQTSSAYQTNPYGIDETRFLNDPVYAQQVINSQPYEVTVKLEQFSRTGKFPS